MIKRLLVAVMGLLIVGAGLTYLALEQSDVLVVETINTSTGEVRSTHIWYVRIGDELYLEAGTPTNPWVQDIQSNPQVKLVGDALGGVYLLRVEAQPTGHNKIRALMRRKYGWRDVWVALLFDTSRSQLIYAQAR